ncbi:MAG: hypothetical protein J7M25_13155 [Deltaproteobacteria bacterium]|nr:hypothetical protein [Deltaproteobacteria bacterium]
MTANEKPQGNGAQNEGIPTTEDSSSNSVDDFGGVTSSIDEAQFFEGQGLFDEAAEVLEEWVKVNGTNERVAAEIQRLRSAVKRQGEQEESNPTGIWMPNEVTGPKHRIVLEPTSGSTAKNPREEGDDEEDEEETVTNAVDPEAHRPPTEQPPGNREKNGQNSAEAPTKLAVPLGMEEPADQQASNISDEAPTTIAVPLTMRVGPDKDEFGPDRPTLPPTAATERPGAVGEGTQDRPKQGNAPKSAASSAPVSVSEKAKEKKQITNDRARLAPKRKSPDESPLNKRMRELAAKREQQRKELKAEKERRRQELEAEKERRKREFATKKEQQRKRAAGGATETSGLASTGQHQEPTPLPDLAPVEALNRAQASTPGLSISRTEAAVPPPPKAPPLPTAAPTGPDVPTTEAAVAQPLAAPMQNAAHAPDAEPASASKAFVPPSPENFVPPSLELDIDIPAPMQPPPMAPRQSPPMAPRQSPSMAPVQPPPMAPVQSPAEPPGGPSEPDRTVTAGDMAAASMTPSTGADEPHKAITEPIIRVQTPKDNGWTDRWSRVDRTTKRIISGGLGFLILLGIVLLVVHIRSSHKSVSAGGESNEGASGDHAATRPSSALDAGPAADSTSRSATPIARAPHSVTLSIVITPKETEAWIVFREKRYKSSEFKNRRVPASSVPEQIRIEADRYKPIHRFVTLSQDRTLSITLEASEPASNPSATETGSQGRKPAHHTGNGSGNEAPRAGMPGHHARRHAGTRRTGRHHTKARKTRRKPKTRRHHRRKPRPRSRLFSL